MYTNNISRMYFYGYFYLIIIRKSIKKLEIVSLSLLNVLQSIFCIVLRFSLNRYYTKFYLSLQLCSLNVTPNLQNAV